MLIGSVRCTSDVQAFWGAHWLLGTHADFEQILSVHDQQRLGLQKAEGSTLKESMTGSRVPSSLKCMERL